MLKLTKVPGDRGPTKVFLSQIEVGTTFYGKIYKDGAKLLLLWAYGVLVDLESPQFTWTIPFPQDFCVYEYCPVDIVGEIREVK